MDFKEIQELIRMVNKTDLAEVEIRNGDFKIKITRQKTGDMPMMYALPQTPIMNAPTQLPQAPVPQSLPEARNMEAPKAETPAGSDNLHTFRSPMIGTFYAASSPTDPPMVKVGDSITVGQKLCVVEAMKLFNEIESDVAGKIVKVLVDNARPVEYDQPLFLIEKS